MEKNFADVMKQDGFAQKLESMSPEEIQAAFAAEGLEVEMGTNPPPDDVDRELSVEEMGSVAGGVYLWTAFCKACGMGMSAWTACLHPSRCPKGGGGFTYKWYNWR